MKKTLSLLLASTLALSACSGGSSSTSTNTGTGTDTGTDTGTGGGTSTAPTGGSGTVASYETLTSSTTTEQNLSGSGFEAILDNPTSKYISFRVGAISATFTPSSGDYSTSGIVVTNGISFSDQRISDLPALNTDYADLYVINGPSSSDGRQIPYNYVTLGHATQASHCLLYTSPSPRDA